MPFPNIGFHNKIAFNCMCYISNHYERPMYHPHMRNENEEYCTSGFTTTTKDHTQWTNSKQ